jgi:preprotein translocase subunit YajC
MISAAWAQGAPAGAPSAIVQFLPLILIFVVFYFLLIRPQQQKQRAHQQLIDNLKLNDDVITAGGIYGKVVGVQEKIVTLEIAPNVRIRVDRPQIASLAGKSADKPKEKEKDKQK